MRVLKCEIEDLPEHIAAIERYTHFYKVDIVKHGIRNQMIENTKKSYEPNSRTTPTKLVDDTGNTIQYMSFYYATSTTVTICLGAFLTVYGNKYYSVMEMWPNLDLQRNHYVPFMVKEDTTEVLYYQREGRARFTSNPTFTKLTKPGEPLEGWTVRILVKIPPYGMVEDELLAKWLVGYWNGIVPERMVITQIVKTNTSIKS